MQHPVGGRLRGVSISVYLARQWVPSEELSAALHDVYERSPDQNVVIRAHAGLPYERVREVMRLVNRAGWSGAGVETREREPVSGDS